MIIIKYYKEEINMSIKVLKVAKAALKTPGVFAGGVAFGTFGLKLLSSKDAKKDTLLFYQNYIKQKME